MWFWYSLTSAILGSFESIFNKRTLNKTNPILFTWAQFTLSLPILAFLAFRYGSYPLSSIFYLGAIGAGLVFVLSKNISNHVIKESNLSQIVPLNACTILFTFILGNLFLAEHISALSTSGVALIIFGVYILNAEGAKEDLLRPFRVLYTNKLSLLYLFALLLSSLEGILIKTSLNHSISSNVALVMFIEQFVMTILLTVYLYRHRDIATKELKTNSKGLIISSIFYVTITYLSFTAISATSVVLAQAIKRSQVFFTLLLGIFLLKDRPIKHVWIASILMVIGVILIKISS